MHAKQQDHPGMITVILFTPHAFLLDPLCKRLPRKQISRSFYDQITFRRLKRNGRPDRCIPADFQCVRIGRNYSAFFNTFSIQINPISRRHTFQAHRNVKLRRTVFQFYTVTSPVEHPCIFSGHIRRHPDKLPSSSVAMNFCSKNSHSPHRSTAFPLCSPNCLKSASPLQTTCFCGIMRTVSIAAVHTANTAARKRNLRFFSVLFKIRI